MLRMRYSQDGGVEDLGDGLTPAQRAAERQALNAGTSEPAAPVAGPAPTMQEPPTTDPKPGPVDKPAPQVGSPAISPEPPPPAVVSSVPGVRGSETTGGVQGSFGQAGSAGFSKRFGLPAAWFKGGPSAGLAREGANVGRGVLSKGSVGGGVGGFGAEVAPVAPVGPSQGTEGGGKNDEEWQRILQAALRNRFQK